MTLLSLPVEVRFQILQYVLTPCDRRAFCDPRREACMTSQHGRRDYPRRFERKQALPSINNILNQRVALTCRQIKGEVDMVVLQRLAKTHVCACSEACFRDLWRSCNTIAKRNIGGLTIHLSKRGYYDRDRKGFDRCVQDFDRRIILMLTNFSYEDVKPTTEMIVDGRVAVNKYAYHGRSKVLSWTFSEGRSEEISTR